MTNQSKDKKQAVLIILLLAFLLVLLMLFNKESTIVFVKMKNSMSDLMWLSMNLSIMILYMGCFGVLGYKKAIKNNLNGRFWGIVCGLLGLWGYLYLLFRSDKV